MYWTGSVGSGTNTSTEDSSSVLMALSGGIGSLASDFCVWVRLGRPAVGVESNVSWSCSQNAQPRPECHHGAMCAARREGAGYWF